MPILIVLVALAGLIFVIADLDQIRYALARADWRLVPIALATTAISYTCIGFSFAKVSELLGVNMPRKDLAIIGFVSSVLNHLVLSGGAAGYSVRFMLMNRHGVTMRKVVAISILHFYLTSLLMVAMLPVGLIYLGANAPLGETTTRLLTASVVLLILFILLATALIFRDTLRRRVVGWLVKAANRLIRRDVSAPLERFDETMTLGVQAMHRDPVSMATIASLVAIDWMFSATTLWLCFRAFGVVLSPGELISGFVIGTVAGVASFLPGGLGVQEASMTGIFALLGVTLEVAALAAILYRVVYSIAPYLLSLGFYRLVLRPQEEGNKHAAQEATYENPYA